MAGTLTVDTIQSDSSYVSTLNVASKINFSGGMQIGGQDATFGGMRNRIINGDMRIDQRNAGASVTPTTGVYIVDRWSAQLSQLNKFSVQQVTDAPSGFSYSSKITSLSAYSVVSGDYFVYRQHIEGYNSADLGFGTATASTVTVSFWVKSSLTGSFSVSIYNIDGTRTYPALYTINSANTWEYKTVTISGSNSGTWGTTNGIGISIAFGLGGGSTYSSTPGTWNTNTWTPFATGATQVVGTNGATLQVTGVQLEKGSAASAFEYRPYGTELQLCQRYYIKWLANATNAGFGMGRGDGSSVPLCVITYPATMRASPTLTQSNTLINTPTSYTVSGISSSSLGTNSGIVAPQMATGTVTSGYACAWIANASTSYIDLSAEL